MALAFDLNAGSFWTIEAFLRTLAKGGGPIIDMLRRPVVEGPASLALRHDESRGIGPTNGCRRLREQGNRSNAICPDTVHASLDERISGLGGGADAQSSLQRQPIGRFGSAAIAALAPHLASDDRPSLRGR